MLAPSRAPAPEPAFRDVYRDHAEFVWRVLRRLGVPDADLEDVTQEVFVVVLKKLETFAHRSSLRTWLYGIAYRCASEHRRRAHVRSEVPTETPDAGAADPAQLESLDRKRARDQLDAILARLDDDKRAVFVFYEIEELEVSEVAEILGCPVQTVYSRLRVAREHVEAAARRLAAREAR